MHRCRHTQLADVLADPEALVVPLGCKVESARVRRRRAQITQQKTLSSSISQLAHLGERQGQSRLGLIHPPLVEVEDGEVPQTDRPGSPTSPAGELENLTVTAT